MTVSFTLPNQVTSNISSLQTFDSTLPTTYLELDGSNAMTGNLNVNNHKITNLTTGTASTDAANVGNITTALVPYLTTATATSTYLPITGGPVTGGFSMSANINMNTHQINNVLAPTISSDAVNKLYSDTGDNYEPPFIKSLSPYLHLVADAYSNVTATSGVFDLSSNNQVITYAGGTG